MAIPTAWKIDETTGVLTTNYQKWTFPDLAAEFVVINDEDPETSAVLIHISWKGVDDNFVLKPGEFKPWVAGRNRFKEALYLKYSGAAAPDYRGMSAPRG